MSKKLSRNKKIVIITALSLVLVFGLTMLGLVLGYSLAPYGVEPKISARAENVILLIGDGMGKNHIEIASFFDTPVFTELAAIGDVTTRSLDFLPTDSAAAATAMATGKKVWNRNISHLNGKDLTNLGEVTKQYGKKLGVISTKSVTDATPAAFTAHTKVRSKQKDIAKQQIFESGADVIFGLGREYYDPYAAQIETADRGYYNTFAALQLNQKSKAFAIFDDPIPNEGLFSLSGLTEIALAMLENDNGFFLMVEGAKIDTYSHKNEMEKMLAEFWAFNAAVEVALKYAQTHPNTTVIITADHETGKLTLPKTLSAESINNKCFRSGSHTARDVSYFAYGAGADEIPNKIDNTDIFYIIKQLLS